MNRIDGARLCYTDGEGCDRQLTLSADVRRVTVGRSHRSDLALTWDRTVSRLHAAIEWIGTHWSVIDDGLSRNGTFVNGERLAGRRRLRSGDIIQIGVTAVTFAGQHHPGPGTPQVRAFITALAKHRLIFDEDVALAYLSALDGAASENNQLRYTDERLEQEARDLADRVRQSMPDSAADRDYYAFTLTSTGDLLEKLSRSMMIMLEAQAAGALPVALPFADLANIYINTVRELSKAITVDPLPASTPAGTRYPLIGSVVIEGMATLFEALGSLLLDHGYLPTHALCGEDPLALATKAIARASALRAPRR
ncbi:FHA domain-containing protein [Rhodococcus sp. NPDC059968]|uniref:FHA domain-containing protein n=1 Tax=Rhodococcus sp. NPDC059968 TaxID=3347017 RepID=UPI00366C98FF